MAFYYIKSGGTATGDSGRTTTARTGAFPSMGAGAYYDSLKDIFQDSATTGNTKLSTGDSVRCSDLHNKIYTGSTDIGINIVSANNQYIDITSVDDANCEEYKPGAHEENTTGSLTLYSSSIEKPMATFNGMSFKSTDDTVFLGSNECINYFNDCILESGEYIDFGKGGETLLNDCDLIMVDGLNVDTGAVPIDITGGSITSVVRIFYYNGSYRLNGVDLSNSTAGISLITLSGATGSCDIVLTDCKYPANYNFSSGTQYPHGFRMSGTSYQPGNSNSYFQWMSGCLTETSTAIYRNGGSTDRDGVNFSSDITTYTDLSSDKRRFFKVKLGTYSIDLTSPNTLTFHIMQQNSGGAPAGLDDQNCWVELHQNDTTDTELALIKKSNDSITVLDTATTLTTSTETWEGVGAESTANQTKQQLTVTTSAIGGLTNGNVTAYLYIAKDISSGSDELFVCPKPVVT